MDDSKEAPLRPSLNSSGNISQIGKDLAYFALPLIFAHLARAPAAVTHSVTE
jgi:hypothetical protein